MPMLPAGSSVSWLDRLPHYLYFDSVLRGRRVLELGCGEGYGAFFLANRGAGHVVAVDRSRASIDEARDKFVVSNLEFRTEDYTSIELPDDSFDVICVPDGVNILRRSAVLGELRRVLRSDGRLIISGASADREGGGDGASFVDFLSRLGSAFAPVRMFGQSPWVAVSLVGYQMDEDADSTPPMLRLDSTLVDRRDEFTYYIAVCGGDDLPGDDYSIIRLPPDDAVDVIARELGSALSSAAVEAEARRTELLSRVRELEDMSGTDEAPAPTSRRIRERRRSMTAIAERTQLRATIRTLRERLTSAEEELGRALGVAGMELAEAREAASRLRVEADELRFELDRLTKSQRSIDAMWEDAEDTADLRGPIVAAVRDVGGADAAAPAGEPDGDAAERLSVTEMLASALEVHREQMADARAELDESQAYVAELEAELAEMTAKLEDARVAKHVAEVKTDEVRAELGRFRDRAAAAEGQVLRLSGGEPADPIEPPPPAAAPTNGTGAMSGAAADRVFVLELLLADLEKQFDELRVIVEGQVPLVELDHAELIASLSQRDAEITFLHIGVKSLQRRLDEVVAAVHSAPAAAPADAVAALEALAARVRDLAGQ